MRDNFVFRSSRQTEDRIRFPFCTPKFEETVDESVVDKCSCIVFRDGNVEICGHPTASGILLCFKHRRQAKWTHEKYTSSEQKAKEFVEKYNFKDAIKEYHIAIIHRQKQQKIYNTQYDSFDHDGAIRYCRNEIQQLVVKAKHSSDNNISRALKSEVLEETNESDINETNILEDENVKNKLVREEDEFESMINKAEVVYNNNFELSKRHLGGDVGKYLAVYLVTQDVKLVCKQGSTLNPFLKKLRFSGIEVWLQLPKAGRDGRPGIFFMSSPLNIQPEVFTTDHQAFIFGSEFKPDQRQGPREPGKFNIVDLKQPKARGPLFDKTSHTLLYLGEVLQQPVGDAKEIRLGITEEEAKKVTSVMFTKKIYGDSFNIDDINMSQYQSWTEAVYEITNMNPDMIDEQLTKMKRLYDAGMKSTREDLCHAMRLRPETPEENDSKPITRMKEALRNAYDTS
jgi:hypothetical protein